MSEPIVVAEQLPFAAGPERHYETLMQCPRCAADLMKVGLTDLAYVFDACACEAAPYVHLVEQMWHRSCHAAEAGEEAARLMDDLETEVRDGKRETLAKAQRAILAEANRGEAKAPRAQRLTYTGGLRRASRIVEALLGEVLDGHHAS